MYNNRAFQRNQNHHQSDNDRSCGGYSRKKMWKKRFASSFNTPPVNVRELDDKYELHLFAPGLEKSDFVISVADQVLSISVDAKNSDQGNWKRIEHVFKGFDRKFELNEKIDTAAITAKYENGVLVVSLTKLEGFETSRQEIEIV